MRFIFFLKGTASKNLYFFTLLVCYLFLGCFVLFSIRKGDEVIWLNQFHSAFSDFFFQYLTHLGDGLFCIFLSLVFLAFKKYKNALLIFLSFASSGISAQLLKRLAFPNMPRPTAYLSGKNIDWHFVEGVEVLSSNSFPSGHTATAFATFLMLALINKHKLSGIFFFLLAFLVGLSRIYLLQHFFIDTYFGTILGVVCSLLVYYWAVYNK